MRSRQDRAELIEAICEGYAAAERGETRPAEEFFAEFASRNGIQVEIAPRDQISTADLEEAPPDEAA